MNTTSIGTITLGDGRPKICLPIVGKTLKEIIEQAQTIIQNPVDIVEWRADWFEGICDYDATIEVTETLRGLIGITPLLYTIRTSAEGGEADISWEAYTKCLLNASEDFNIDAIDVEILKNTESEIASLIQTIKRIPGNVVIASSHDFTKTPSKEDIILRLSYMEQCGADVCKMAVMPQSMDDVLTLLAATNEASQKISKPLITMSMGKYGLVSRLAGEAFGSTLTFGCAGKASAPGQIAAAELAQVLEIIHKNSL